MKSYRPFADLFLYNQQQAVLIMVINNILASWLLTACPAPHIASSVRFWSVVIQDVCNREALGQVRFPC